MQKFKVHFMHILNYVHKTLGVCVNVCIGKALSPFVFGLWTVAAETKTKTKICCTLLLVLCVR